MAAIDLSLLPKPGVIEEVSYNAIVARQRQKFMEVWAGIRIAYPDAVLPEYDVQLLETDPATIINQSETYRETVLRARINDAVRANLLAFARGSDLDHLGAFYDVVRLANEDDDRFAERIILAIQGRSTGGTAPRYKSVAMGVDLAVADVIIYTIGRSPLIHVAVYSTDPDGVASPELLAKVEAALQDPFVKMVNDTFEVASAVQTVVNIEADIWLLPDAPTTTLDTAKSELLSAWSTTRALGRDLVISWWTSRLMVTGVHKVAPVSPLSDIIVDPFEAISIGTVTLNNRGRAF